MQLSTKFTQRPNAWVMQKCLAAIRRWNNHWRESSEHRVPHWAADSLEIIEHLNLLPTALAILLVPRHFFRKTRQILQGHEVYKTPIKFIYSSIPLLIGFHYLPMGDLYKAAITSLPVSWMPETAQLRVWMSAIDTMPDWQLIVAVLVLTPLWIPILSILAYIILLVPSAANVISDETLNRFRVPLDWRTYWRLDTALFFWNLLYFSVYFLVTFPFVLVGLRAAFGNPSWPFRHIGVLVIWQIGIRVGFVASIVVSPYTEMLRGSLRLPTPLLRELQIAPLNKLLMQLRGFVEFGSKMQTKQGYKALRYYLTQIQKECTRLRIAFVQENARPAWRDKWKDTCLIERKNSLSKLSTEPLITLQTWPLDEPTLQQLGACVECIRSVRAEALR
jgi:hypothetical protein